jgi:RNA polymerase-binding transcription factor DksA
MSFAYIEGQEAQALASFEKQLEQCTDSNQRKELEAFIAKLRAKIKEANQTLPQSSQESFSLCCTSAVAKA